MYELLLKSAIKFCKKDLWIIIFTLSVFLVVPICTFLGHVPSNAWPFSEFAYLDPSDSFINKKELNDLKLLLTDDQISRIQEIVDQKIKEKNKSIVWSIIKILTLFLLVISAIFSSLSEKKIDFEAVSEYLQQNIPILSGWPLSYILKNNSVIKPYHNNSVSSNPQKKIDELISDHKSILLDLQNTISRPLSNLNNHFVAEVIDSRNTTKDDDILYPNNIALVRIRYVERPRDFSHSVFETPLSAGSLVYEGLAIDRLNNVTYWQTSPLCIDLFSLGEDISNAHSVLLFKSTEGKVVKLQPFSEISNEVENVIENFGFLKIPKNYLEYNPESIDLSKEDVSIQGYFTDFVQKGQGEGIDMQKKSFFIRPVAQQLKNSTGLFDEVINQSIGLLNRANVCASKCVQYTKSCETPIADKSGCNEEIACLKNDFLSFVSNSRFWKSNSYFKNFHEEMDKKTKEIR